MNLLEIAALRNRNKRKSLHNEAVIQELGFYPENKYSDLAFLILGIVYGKKSKRIRAATLIMKISDMLKSGDTRSLTLLDIAKNTNQYERYHLRDYAIQNTFGKCNQNEYPYMHQLITNLVALPMHNRMLAAKEIVKLADLKKDKRLYVTLLDAKYKAGTYEDMIKLAGYSSTSEYELLVHEAIQNMYNDKVYHHTDYVTHADELKPLSQVASPSSTREDSLNDRKKMEEELGLVDCIYATTAEDVYHYYGKTRLEIDLSKYDYYYHIGDTLKARFQDSFVHSQKPFKKGKFDIYQHKYIAPKEQLLQHGASAMQISSRSCNDIIEVLLIKKKEG